MLAMVNVTIPQNALDEALKWARKLAEINPTSEQSWTTLGRVYNLRDEPALAFEALDRGLEKVPGSDLVAYLRLVAAFDAGRADVCSELVPATLAEEGRDDPRLLLLDARCALRDGREGAALDILETAVDRGFRRLDVLAGSPEFARLAGGERFRELQARTESEK